MPNVSTVVEMGLPDTKASFWIGIHRGAGQNAEALELPPPTRTRSTTPSARMAARAIHYAVVLFERLLGTTTISTGRK